MAVQAIAIKDGRNEYIYIIFFQSNIPNPVSSLQIRMRPFSVKGSFPPGPLRARAMQAELRNRIP